MVSVFALGVVRILERPNAKPPLFLFLAMAVAVVYGLLVARKPPPRSALAQAYLDWLDAATTSLQRDVQSGRRTDPEEVSLVIATAGLAGLVTLPAFNAFSSPLSVAYTPVASSSSGSGCGSSGYSSGGDGGGGGCGGGGCGGVGGCG